MSIISEGVQFISEVYERRKQIYDLTKRDFNDRYTGSFKFSQSVFIAKGE